MLKNDFKFKVFIVPKDIYFKLAVKERNKGHYLKNAYIQVTQLGTTSSDGCNSLITDTMAPTDIQLMKGTTLTNGNKCLIANPKS